MQKNKPKIIHVIWFLGYGGAEMLLTNLLPKIKSYGFDIRLVTLSDNNPLGPRLRQKGCSITALGCPTGSLYRVNRWLPIGYKLHKFLKSVRPEIIHTHIYRADILTRIFAPPNTKIITTLHNTEPWWSCSSTHFKIKTFVETKLAKYRKVDFIAVSESVAERAVEVFRLHPDRIQIVYNGIDLAQFPIRDIDFPKRFLKIIQVGRMEPQKGHDVSLSAFKLLLSEIPDATLLFVGDGPLRKQLEMKAEEIGILGKVKFLGTRDDVPKILKEASLFWMPSRFEGFGIALLEAMASQLPTVSTNVGGLSKIVVNGVTGFLIPPDDPVALSQASIKILKSPSLAKSMGAAGRRRVEELFSLDRTTMEYCSIYENILKHGKFYK